MKLRGNGKEVYIIAGVAAVVVIVAWYLFFLNPVESRLNTANTQIASAQTSLSEKSAQVAQLQALEQTAPQAKVDLIELGKMLPSQGNVPSLIIELTQTAELSGLQFGGITPALPQTGTPFGIQSINLTLTGSFFNLEDFLYRLEQYVQFNNGDIVATGRLLEPVSIQMSGSGSGSTTTSSIGNSLTISLTLNAYLWPAAALPATTATTGGAQ
ncbi:MAG: type 4a pilus biogenesis protein PilO [Thermoleophilia bacterium]